jgi:outer membrane protein OmpA-like peptidoglycan-associated protein
MKPVATLMPVLLALCSCSSPPKPPTVDESRRHPVNVGTAVQLQGCKSDLQSTRILATEMSRNVQTAHAAFDKLAAQQKAVLSSLPRVDDVRSTVYTILFPFGGTKIELTPAQGEQLAREAQAAPLILLSGRTDGASESPAESRIARERTDAVRALLLNSGVPPAHIRATWQPVGDQAAENNSARGRALNRRVEIEIYRLAPRIAQLAEAGSQ